MLEERPDSIDLRVTDAIGGLTNMVAGVAKAQLDHYELSASLPSVVTGKGHAMDFLSGAETRCIPYECKWGDVVVEVGFVEEPSQVAEPASV